jgi:hypothetical protein
MMERNRNGKMKEKEQGNKIRAKNENFINMLCIQHSAYKSEKMTGTVKGVEKQTWPVILLSYL